MVNQVHEWCACQRGCSTVGPPIQPMRRSVHRGSDVRISLNRRRDRSLRTRLADGREIGQMRFVHEQVCSKNRKTHGSATVKTPVRIEVSRVSCIGRRGPRLRQSPHRRVAAPAPWPAASSFCFACLDPNACQRNRSEIAERILGLRFCNSIDSTCQLDGCDQTGD
jgi:hypothetical protein